MFIVLLTCLFPFCIFAQFPLNTSLPEQYSCVLASDQYVPAQSPPSPFMGIFYMTVTPVSINNVNPADNTFRFDTFLYHNIDYATQAYICGPAARGHVTNSTCFFPLFLPPKSATASDCPLYSHMIVYQDVVDLLREGLLFAMVASGGLSSGQIRGQIENRNDIFFTPITGKNTSQIVGASILRLFDIQGYTFVDVKAPAGIEMYVIAGPDFNDDDISGFSVVNNQSVLAFGNLNITNSVANTIFNAAITLVIREGLEKRGLPVYGFNSSNMMLIAQDFGQPVINGSVAVPTFDLGRYIRLPYLKFTGNEIFVFTQTGSTFGGGGGTSDALSVFGLNMNSNIILGLILTMWIIVY